VPARLDAAASGQPPALRDAHDPLADANIATDVEDVVAGPQVTDAHDPRRSGRVRRRRPRVVLGGAAARGERRGSDEYERADSHAPSTARGRRWFPVFHGPAANRPGEDIGT